MSESFVVINGQSYYEGDWLKDHRVTDNATPAVIETATLLDDGSTVLWMRSPDFLHYSLTLMEFVTLVEDGVFEKIDKPRYYVGQKFRNRFTEKSLEIVDVPRLRNEKEKEYVYFVLTFTPTFGFNHEVQKESEVTHFYVSEGVVEI